jgi:hypothetical protein
MLGERDFLTLHLEAFKTERRLSAPADLYRDFVPWLLQPRVVVHAVDLMEPVIDLGTRSALPRSLRRDPAPAT